MSEPDPFDLLALPPTFDLSPGQIQGAYFAQSASLHPDVAAGDAEAQRRMAALNHAKGVLDDPERRARVLLARLEAASGSSAEDRSSRALPQGFLMEMMEVREEIEAALADPGRRPETRARWESWAEDQRQQAIGEVGEMFRGLCAGGAGSAEQLAAIRTRLNAWRYIERLIEQLDPDYDPRRADFEN